MPTTGSFLYREGLKNGSCHIEKKLQEECSPNPLKDKGSKDIKLIFKRKEKKRKSHPPPLNIIGIQALVQSLSEHCPALHPGANLQFSLL